MLRNIKRVVLKGLSYLFSERVANWFARFFTKRLVDEFRGAATDKFLELLLLGMDIAFCLSRTYRKNLKDFEAIYVFETDGGRVNTSALFGRSNMAVLPFAKDQCTVRVVFDNPASLRAFLFSRDQDILDSLLKNQVTVEGNLNYIYKFGFMARDLLWRLGID